MKNNIILILIYFIPVIFNNAFAQSWETILYEAPQTSVNYSGLSISNLKDDKYVIYRSKDIINISSDGTFYTSTERTDNQLWETGSVFNDFFFTYNHYNNIADTIIIDKIDPFGNVTNLVHLVDTGNVKKYSLAMISESEALFLNGKVPNSHLNKLVNNEIIKKLSFENVYYFNLSRNKIIVPYNGLQIYDTDLNFLYSIELESLRPILFEFNEKDELIVIATNDSTYAINNYELLKFDSSGNKLLQVSKSSTINNQNHGPIQLGINGENIAIRLAHEELDRDLYIQCYDKDFNLIGEQYNEDSYFGNSIIVPNDIGGFVYHYGKGAILDYDITSTIVSTDSACQVSNSNQFLSGKVYFDENSNGIFDSNDNPLEGMKIMHNSNIFSFTDYNGNYVFKSNPGINIIRLVNPESCFMVQDSIVFDINNVTSFDQFDFPVTSIFPNKKLEIYTESSLPRCNETTIYNITLRNIGCIPMDGTITIAPNSLLTPLDPSKLVQNVSLSPFNNLTLEILFILADESFIGDTIRIDYNFTSGDYSLDTFFIAQLICAYDPNDKQVTPIVTAPDGTDYSLLDQESIFTIRFQNEGNDTAFLVKVVDTLSNNFDINTFRPLHASHEYSIKIVDNIIKYTFRNINLPYQAIDDLGSQGFFSFAIKTKSDTPNETTINNKAAIFFDFNFPIITNSTKQTFVEFLDEDQDGYYFWDDCNDQEPLVYPGLIEIPYNGIDEDCNPLTFDDDLDQDGFILAEDCDDTNNAINSAQIEIPYNGIDEDCNPLTFDDDLDQDGFLLAEDCDDTNNAINSAQIEIPYNGIDEDCNPLTFDDDLDQDGFLLAEDCDDTNNAINPAQIEIPYNGIDEDCNPLTLDDDLDQDGFILVEDCDDTNNAINPNGIEIANNGIDEDCDGADLITNLRLDEFFHIAISPNPATNSIQLKLDERKFKVVIYNNDSKILKVINDAQGTQNIELEDFVNGIYFAEITLIDTKKSKVLKFVIQK